MEGGEGWAPATYLNKVKPAPPPASASVSTPDTAVKAAPPPPAAAASETKIMEDGAKFIAIMSYEADQVDEIVRQLWHQFCFDNFLAPNPHPQTPLHTERDTHPHPHKPPHTKKPHAHAVHYALLSANAFRVLTGACNPMVWRMHV